MKIRSSAIENFILIILLGFAPLALASVHAWAYCVIALAALIIFNLHFLNDIESFKRVIKRPESIGAIVFLAVSLLYITPLPPMMIKALSPSTYALWQNYTIDPPSLMTLSVYVHATSLYVLKFVTYFMVFLVVVAKISGKPSAVSFQLSASDDKQKTPEELTSSRAHELKQGISCGSHNASRFTHHPSHSPLDELTSSRAYELRGSLHAPRSMPHAYLMLGALCAVLSILIHSLSDFNLHIPANALYFTVMLAIVAGLSSVVSRQSSEERGQKTEHEIKEKGKRKKEKGNSEASLRGSALNCHCEEERSDDEAISMRPRFAEQSERGSVGRIDPERSKGSHSDDHCACFKGVHKNELTGLRAHEPHYSFVSFLVNSVILISFTIAVFGILQKLSYNGKIYWVIKKAGGHFGPYVNRDHFAGYMEMCVFLALASFLAKVSESSLVHLKKWKDKVVWFSTKEANKTLIYLFFAVVMTTALFMTTSRGGIMSFIASLSIMYFACLISAERKKRKRILIASAAVVVLIVIMFAWVGPEETLSKFQALQVMIKTFIHERAILSELRPYFWQDTVHLIKDFPVVGTGLGTYQYIFPKYRTFSEHWGLLQFAHNDYIQLIAEMGVVGGVFLLGFLAWYIRRFRQCLRGMRE